MLLLNRMHDHKNVQDGSLDRFLLAQNRSARAQPHTTVYEMALSEICSGRKLSHWIWFILPQGPFGTSMMARRYAISDPDEAANYLRESTLRSRLLEMTNGILVQLKAGVPVLTLMGSQTDSRKLVSCLTLFEAVATRLGDEEVRIAMSEVLGNPSLEMWPRCMATLNWLGEVH